MDESALLFRPLRNRAFGQRVTSAEIAEQINGGGAMSRVFFRRPITLQRITEPLSHTARSDRNFRVADDPLRVFTGHVEDGAFAELTASSGLTRT